MKILVVDFFHWAPRILAMISAFIVSNCVNTFGQGTHSDGCLPLFGATQTPDGAVRLTAVNESCRRLLVEEGILKRRLHVDSSIYLCAVANAFALPEGDVYLGQPLIDIMLQQHGPQYAFQAAGFIVAHEYGHEFQFRIAKARDIKINGGSVTELQADILGGYWIGMRLQEQRAPLEAIGHGGEINQIYDIELDAAYAIGDYAFNSPSHHGTPVQRHEAVRLGMQAGFASKFGAADSVFTDKEDDIFDWSLTEAKRLTGG